MFFETLTGMLVGLGAVLLVNAFANINQKTDSSREPHKDRFSKPATHRLLAYIVDGAANSRLILTVEGQEHVISIPSGSGILVPEAILNEPHKHDTPCVNLAFILELQFEELVISAPSTCVNEQPQFNFEPFTLAFDSAEPQSVFQASPSRWGSFSAPTRLQSLQCMAMAFLTEAKGNRIRGDKKAARTLVQGMSLQDLEKLAHQRGMELAATAALPGDLDYKQRLETVRNMSLKEREELASQRAMELAATAALPGNLDYKQRLETVRNMSLKEREELASQRGMELAATAALPGDLDYKQRLETVRNMSLKERKELASQRMSELGKKLNCALLLDILCMMFAHAVILAVMVNMLTLVMLPLVYRQRKATPPPGSPRGERANRGSTRTTCECLHVHNR